MNLLEDNLKALFTVNPVLATKLFQVEGNKDFEVFIDEKDNANINIIDNRTFKPMYTTKALDEVMEYYKAFEKVHANNPFLYFYGLGNGILYKLLVSNSNYTRIVVVEPELEILYIVLSLVNLQEEIISKRLRLFLAEDLDFQTTMILLGGQSKLYAKVYDLHVACSFYEEYSEQIIELNRQFVRVFEHMIYSFGNDSKDAMIGIENHVKNMSTMIKNPMTTEIFKKAKSTDTAVIVSTGPSLTKQLPLLKKMKDHITIISVDASYPVLYENGIKPDFVVTIERTPKTIRFYENIPDSFKKDVIFVLASVVDNSIIESLNAGTIMLTMRAFGYTKYYELHEWGYLGRGMSAANMSFDIAAAARFKNIVLIGQDLAYGDDGLSHAGGHVFGKDNVKEKDSDILVEKYGGGGMVKTTKVWEMFRNYFESNIQEAMSERQIPTYNCTEGGARIPGSIEMPFSEAMEKLVDASFVKEQIQINYPTDEEYAKASAQVQQKLEHIVDWGERLQKEVEEVFLKTAAATEMLEKYNKEERLDEVDYDPLLELIDDIEVIKKTFEDKEFKLIFSDVLQAMLMHQEVAIAQIQIKVTETAEEKKAKIVEWIFAHRYWLFSFAGAVNIMLNDIKRSGQEYLGEYIEPEAQEVLDEK